jgi:hypothetical protein
MEELVEELVPRVVPTFYRDIEPNGWTVAPRRGRPLSSRQTLDGAGLSQGSVIDLRPPSEPPTSYLLRSLSETPHHSVEMALALDRSPFARRLRQFRSREHTAVARLVALTAVILASFVGIAEEAASGQWASADLAPAASESRTIPPPTHGSLGRPIQLRGLRLTVAAIDLAAAPPRGATVRSGDRLVAADVRYHDVGNLPVIVSPYDWVLTGPSNSLYDAVEDTAADGLPQRQLAPGQSVHGLVLFDVPSIVPGGLVLNFNAEQGYETAIVKVT